MDDKNKLEFNQLYKSIKNDSDLFTDKIRWGKRIISE